jgi:hypothetical protein
MRQQRHVEGVSVESASTAFRARSFGQIIGDSFKTYYTDIVKYTAIAAIVIVPAALCSGILLALGDFVVTAVDGWSNPGRNLVSQLPSYIAMLLFSILAYPIMCGALIHAMEQKRLGQPISIGQAYLAALKKAGRLIGASLAVSALLSVMILPLLLLTFALFGQSGWLYVPAAVLAMVALYFAIKWLLVLQAVMLDESRATQSLHRSSALVARNWWRSLGIWALLDLVPALIVGSPVFILITSWGDPGGSAAIILQRVLSLSPALVVFPLSKIAETLLYFDLLTRREQYTSQIMGGGMEVPLASHPEYSPQMPSARTRQPRRLKLKPALIVIAVAVVLAAVITPAVLYLHNRADAGDIQVFVKRLSTGKEVRLGHSTLKTFEYTDFAFVVEFDGSVQAGEQENTVEIVGSDDTWSDGLARVRVYAEQGSEEEFYAPVQYDFHLPEEDPGNELDIRLEILDEHHILVSSTAGSFPAASHIALNLDYGTVDGIGYGYAARLFTC